MATDRIPTFGGPLVVIAYSALMAVMITVLDPIAAVPSMSYAQSIAVLAASGTNVEAEVIAVVAFAAFGVALSVVVAVFGAAGKRGLWSPALWQLAVVAAGAPATFVASFSLGFDVADTFGVGGGAHTAWSGLLYGVSAIAFAGIIVLAIIRHAVGRRGAMAVSGGDNPFEGR
jgi:hypothetical protein